MDIHSLNIDDINRNNNSPQDILKWAIERFHPEIGCACSFEDVVIVHIIANINRNVRIFAIDTGRLNEETLELADFVQRQLGINIDWYFPNHEDIEKLERERGLFSFRDSLESRHECCRIRKVEPLNRALSGLKAWITGLRRDQSITRGGLQAVEYDDAHDGIVKINPLANWNNDKVQTYIREHNLPQNRLCLSGYASIGCAPCTRAIQPGEHPRSGRWWWESPEHKECGIHLRNWVI